MSERPALLGGKAVRRKPWPAWPVWDEREERAVVDVVRSGRWGKIEGDKGIEFEQRFAAYHGAKHGIAVCNGTVSLKIALVAAGIEAGDEVIVPPYTFLATAAAVVEANGTPVFVDIEPQTLNLDPLKIEEAITPRTRAIIPVHLGGLPCDMDAIVTIARRHKLTVIEDAAHAHGSEYKHRRVGTIGEMGSFSFQSSKNLTSGEGGIILTNDDRLAERCRTIHNCGRIAGGGWHEHHVIAGNYRLGELAAAILNVQMDRLDEQTRTRDENGRYLNERLSRVTGITPQKRDESCTRHAQHLYVFRLDEGAWGLKRALFIEAMAAEGVPTGAGYTVPLYRQPLFLRKDFGPYTGWKNARPELDYAAVRLTVCEAMCGGEAVWLTQNILLGTKEDMDDIVGAVEKVYANRRELAEEHAP